MTTNTNCAHYWILEIANGPTSTGMCKLCGTTKEFTNTIDTDGWNNDAVAKRHTKYWREAQRLGIQKRKASANVFATEYPDINLRGKYLYKTE